MVAPAGPMYQAGTLSGNPLAMTAGIETLKIIQEPGVWEGMEARGAQLMLGVEGGCWSSRYPDPGGARGDDVWLFLCRGAGDGLEQRRQVGYGALWQVFPGDAAAGHLYRAFAV